MRLERQSLIFAVIRNPEKQTITGVTLTAAGLERSTMARLAAPCRFPSEKLRVRGDSGDSGVEAGNGGSCLYTQSSFETYCLLKGYICAVPSTHCLVLSHFTGV